MDDNPKEQILSLMVLYAVNIAVILLLHRL